MEGIAQVFITRLRDQETSTEQFRDAADKLSHLLALEASKLLSYEKVEVHTPLAKTAGKQFAKDVVLIPILRSGLAMLPHFLEVFCGARVGFIGMVRDEKTAIATMYYKRLPKIGPNDEVLILDPMLATGGSLVASLEVLAADGVHQEQIRYVGIIAAPEGKQHLEASYPKVKHLIAVTDKELNNEKFILPGIGDFGDRYFVTP